MGQGAQGNAIATGDHSKASATIAMADGPMRQADIVAELSAFHDLLQTIPNLDSKALNRVNEAKEHHRKSASDTDEVKTLLSQAVHYIKSANHIAGVVDQVSVHLSNISKSLGIPWVEWKASLGL